MIKNITMTISLILGFSIPLFSQTAPTSNLSAKLSSIQMCIRDSIEAEWESVTLFKLMKAFERMLSQFEERKRCV